MRRRILSTTNLVRAAITCFWLVMMGLLARREFFAAPPPPLEESAAVVSASSESPRHSRLGIFLNNRKIGRAQIHYIPLPDHTAVVRTRITFLTEAMPGNLQATAAIALDRKGKLASFSALFGAGDTAYSILGSVVGDEIEITHNLGGQTETHRRLPFRGDSFFSSSLTPLVGGIRIAPGERRPLAMWNPLLNRMETTWIENKGNTRILVHGRFRDAQKLELAYGGMILSAWITEQGDVLRQEAPFGLMIEKETD